MWACEGSTDHDIHLNVFYIQPACPPHIFNIPETAGAYSQMTGVLAGFAFTGIILILEPRTRPQNGAPPAQAPNTDPVIMPLIAALVSLLMSTLLYSILAGEEDAPGRAATQELLNGLPFALALGMLLYGITLLMLTAKMPSAAVSTMSIVCTVIVPTLAMYFLTMAAHDSEDARSALLKQPCQVDTILDRVSLPLVVLLLIFLSVAWLTLRWHFAKGHLLQAARLVPIGVLAIGIALGVASGHFGTVEPNYLLPTSIIVTYLCAVWIVLAGLSLLMMHGLSNRGDTDRTKQPDSGPAVHERKSLST